MLAAGVETTASAINTAIFAFFMHRNTFLALHMEIKSVIGDSRSPTLEDMSKLPYPSAIVQETWGWRAPVTVGVPHATTEDDVYEGWVIPKGTSVISNAWAINHNPAFFPSPTTLPQNATCLLLTHDSTTLLLEKSSRASGDMVHSDGT